MTLLTAKQVAAELNITDEQVRVLVKDGQLSFINVGRGKKAPRMRFDPDEITAFKRRRTQTRGQPCISAKRRSRNTTNAKSGSKVFDFLAQRAERAAEKQRLRQEKLKSS